MVNAEDKINKILKELTGTYENLLSLRDDIWIGLDHSSIEEVEVASEFQKQYIRLLDQFSKNSEEIAALVSQFTGVREKETPVVIDSKDYNNERIIKELNKEEPHSITEDFTYKKPYAIIIENCAYKGLENWKDVYKQICKHLAKKNEKLFDSLSSNKELISKQNKKYFTTDKKEIRRAEKITEKTFVEMNLSANDFVKRIQEIFTVFNLQNDDLIIYLRQDRNA